jgi:hypothetical protein
MGIKASAQYTIAEIHEECNVVISNESHVFRANKDNTAVASSTSIQIYGYQGSTQIATTVGTISGLPSAGMTATINNNGKTNTSITVAVTTALTSSIANNGVLTIPITVAGKTINKTFSWSKAQAGATGATGATGEKGETGAPGKDGTNGTSARTYWVTSSVNTITRSMKKTLTPGTITFGAYYRDGNAAKNTAYSGRFIIQESTNGSSWTTKYTSSANESSKVYTPTATTNLVKCTMYAAGGTSTALDELTIGIIDSIDNLEIGGRNLWLNSSFNYGFNGYQSVANNGTIALHSETFNGNSVLEIKRSGFTSTTVNRAYVASTKPPTISSFKKGETFTLSAYVYIDSTIPLDASSNNIMIRGSLGDTPQITISQNDATDKWVLYKNTWTATADGTFAQCFILLGLNGAIRVSQIMLEKANTNSNWTAAPEDLESEIANKAGKDEVSEIVNSNMGSVQNTLNNNIQKEIERTETKIMKEMGTLSTTVTGVQNEIDASGKVIRKLQDYTTTLNLNADGLRLDVNKGKGQNLMRNSVMIQHVLEKGSTTKTKANYWCGFNNSSVLTDSFISNLSVGDDGVSRAQTESGRFFKLDFSESSSTAKYGCVISNAIDLQTNVDNIVFAYKMQKGSDFTNGTIFAGLIFYNDENKTNENKQYNDLGAVSTSSGIGNAYYIGVTEYAVNDKALTANFNQQMISKSLPITQHQVQTGYMETLEVVRRYDQTDPEATVLLEQYITLTYTPKVDSENFVYVVNFDGTKTKVTPDGRKIPLELSYLNDVVTVEYTKPLDNFIPMSSPTSDKIKAEITNLDKYPTNTIPMFYNSSNNKIWVYNPFSGKFAETSNLYNTLDVKINKVRAIIGVRSNNNVKLTGSVSFSDLKIEFDTTSPKWSAHQNEMYGKQYCMDETGFSITTDSNQMFIDEDEIAAYYVNDKGELVVDDPIFQIKKEETILRKTVIHDELLIENTTTTEDDAFVMKQQSVNGKWFYIFY